MSKYSDFNSFNNNATITDLNSNNDSILANSGEFNGTAMIYDPNTYSQDPAMDAGMSTDIDQLGDMQHDHQNHHGSMGENQQGDFRDPRNHDRSQKTPHRHKPAMRGEYRESPQNTRYDSLIKQIIHNQDDKPNKMTSIYKYLLTLTENNVLFNYLKDTDRQAEMDDLGQIHNATVTYLEKKLTESERAEQAGKTGNEMLEVNEDTTSSIFDNVEDLLSPEIVVAVVLVFVYVYMKRKSLF
jgi:hypothetical protein